MPFRLPDVEGISDPNNPEDDPIATEEQRRDFFNRALGYSQQREGFTGGRTQSMAPTVDTEAQPAPLTTRLGRGAGGFRQSEQQAAQQDFERQAQVDAGYQNVPGNQAGDVTSLGRSILSRAYRGATQASNYISPASYLSGEGAGKPIKPAAAALEQVARESVGSTQQLGTPAGPSGLARSKQINVAPPAAQEELNKQILSAVVPTSPGDLALAGAGVVAKLPEGVSKVKNAVTAVKAASELPKPNVIRYAAKPGAVGPTVEEGLAGSRGAVQVVDPTGVRRLAPGEAPAAGESVLFHGTAGDVTGDLRPGTFLTPSQKQAQSYANVATNIAAAQSPVLRARQRAAALLAAGSGFKMRAEQEVGRLASEELGAAKIPGGRVKVGGLTQAEIKQQRNAALSAGEARKNPNFAKRQVAEAPEEAYALGEGLTVDPKGVGLDDLEQLKNERDAIDAAPRNKATRAGVVDAQIEAHRLIAESNNPAQVMDALGYQVSHMSASTPREKARLAELDRLHNKLYTYDPEAGGVSLNWDVIREKPQEPLIPTGSVEQGARVAPMEGVDTRPQLGSMQGEGFRGEQGGIQSTAFTPEQAGQRGQIGLADVATPEALAPKAAPVKTAEELAVENARGKVQMAADSSKRTQTARAARDKAVKAAEGELNAAEAKLRTSRGEASAPEPKPAAKSPRTNVAKKAPPAAEAPKAEPKPGVAKAKNAPKTVGAATVTKKESTYADKLAESLTPEGRAKLAERRAASKAAEGKTPQGKIGEGPNAAAPATRPRDTGPTAAPKSNAKLPVDLSRSAPRYSKAVVTFASDIDRAAYITAQKVKSKADARFVQFVKQETGLSEAEIRAHGAKVRAAIGAQYNGQSNLRLASQELPGPKAALKPGTARITQPDGSEVEATPDAIKAAIKRVSTRNTPPAIEIVSDPKQQVEKIIDAIAGAKTVKGKALFQDVDRDAIREALADSGEIKIIPGHTGPGARHPQPRVQIGGAERLDDVIEEEMGPVRGLTGPADEIPSQPLPPGEPELGGTGQTPLGEPVKPTKPREPLTAGQRQVLLDRGRWDLVPDASREEILRSKASAKGLELGAPGGPPGEPPKGPNTPKQPSFGGEWRPGRAPLWKTAGRVAADTILILPRALGTAFDYSYPLRQGALVGARHQKEFWYNFVKGFQALGSERIARERMAAIHRAPIQGKLIWADWGQNAKLVDREEEFISRWADKIPGIRQSSRAAAVFINGLKSDTLNTVARNWERSLPKGLDGRAIHDADFLNDVDTYSNFLNRATGRGNLGQFERAVGALNTVFYGARRNVAMVQAPGYLFNRSARVRQAAMQDFAGFFGLGATTLFLAHQAGADVGIDPTAADFGKIKVGNTRIDIWGGYQQMARMTWRLANNEYKNPTDLKGSSKIMGDFLRNKLSPLAGLAVDIRAGKNAIGETLGKPGEGIGRLTGDVGPIGNEILKRYVPLGMDGLLAALADDGARGLAFGVTGLLGTGTQTYQSSADVRNQAAVKLGLGSDYSKLNPVDQAAVNATPEVEAYTKAHPTAYQQALEKNQSESPYIREAQAAVSNFTSTPPERQIKDIWHDAGIDQQATARALSNQFAEQFAHFDKNRFQKAVEGYYAIDKQTPGQGRDFDAVTAARQDYVAGLPSDEQEWVNKAIVAAEERRDPLRQEYDAYIAKKKDLGYYADDVTPAKRKEIDTAHPELDVQSWKFGATTKQAGPALQTPEAVDKAIALHLGGRPIKYEGFSRPVDQSDGTKAAFHDAQPYLDKLQSDVETAQNNTRQLRLRARALYRKNYDALTDDQQAKVRTAIATTVRERSRLRSPALEAYLAYFGAVTTVSRRSAGRLKALQATYGDIAYDKQPEVKIAR